jgi:flavin reductase (DIM6/NTAB) family NADH-FMN oxidoreductase RutF
MKMKQITAIIILLSALSVQCQTLDKAGDAFRKITYKEFENEAIKLIGDDWMLVTAGDSANFNMMTANWGGLGWLWNKPVAFIFVRPQRYTFEFTEKEDHFTLSFFYEEQRDILKLMGTKSGRDINKMNTPGLSPFKTPHNSVAFKEAKIIIECRKLYATNLVENDFTDKALRDRIYPTKDFHRMYVGEIVNIWIKP